MECISYENIHIDEILMKHAGVVENITFHVIQADGVTFTTSAHAWLLSDISLICWKCRCPISPRLTRNNPVKILSYLICITCSYENIRLLYV